MPALGLHEDQVSVVGRGDEDRERSLRQRVHHSREHAGLVEIVRNLAAVESDPATARGLLRYGGAPDDGQPLGCAYQGEPVRT
jgi:hypothetical protein